MALPVSGPISSSQIANELAISSASFSANSAELLVYTDLNALSISSSGNILNIDTPISMSEWYGYDHTFKVSGSVVTSSVGLNAPYTASYSYTTFAQVEMGITSSLFGFTGSSFVSSGIAPTSSVPYAIYYAPYSLTMSSSKQLLKTGVLTAASPSNKFNYTYLPASGSVVTFLFKTVPTASSAATTTAYLKYDQFSSSISSSGIWNNLGTGGATYNLRVFNAAAAVSSSGTGTGSYVSLNTGSIKNQYATGSGINIGLRDFSVSTVFRLTKWWDNVVSGSSYTAGEIFNITDTTTTGFQIVTAGPATSGSGTGSIIFSTLNSGSGNVTSLDNQSLNNFYHLTFLFNSTSSNSSLYLNNTLIDSYTSGSNYPRNMTGTLKINVGMQKTGLYFPVGVHLAALSVWTGSILTPGQITALNNEYKSRYQLYTIPSYYNT
jgi:hypothetical protein